MRKWAECSQVTASKIRGLAGKRIAQTECAHDHRRNRGTGDSLHSLRQF